MNCTDEMFVLMLVARGPPLRDACDAPVGAGMQGEPDRATDRDRAAQPAVDHAVDQRVNWCGSKAALPTGCGLMLRARLPPRDFATQSLAVQVIRQIGKQALVGALTQPTRVILRLERLNFLAVESAQIGGGEHRLLAIYPISGPSTMMRDRDDSNFRWRDLINHAVGKSAQGEPTPGATKDCAGERIRKYEVCSSVEFCKECKAELDIRFCRIERRRLIQLGEGKRNDNQFHFNFARAWASASAMGMT